jgi:hypothetical protein
MASKLWVFINKFSFIHKIVMGICKLEYIKSCTTPTFLPPPKFKILGEKLKQLFTKKNTQFPHIQ